MRSCLKTSLRASLLKALRQRISAFFFVDVVDDSYIVVSYMQRSKVLWPAPRRVLGTVILAFCSYAPLSRASVIVNNLGSSTSFSDNGPLAQVFTMPADTSGDVTTLTLKLTGYAPPPASEVYIYNFSSGSPASYVGPSLYDIGSISSGSGVVTISDNSALLSAGQSYAIVMDPGSSGRWQATHDSASGGSGTLGDYFGWNGSAWVDQGANLQMDLEVSAVPELPMTGMVMGIGALGVVIGHGFRRKISWFFPLEFGV